VTILMQPILPIFASRVEEQLNLPSLKWTDLDRIVENHRIDGAKIILRKIEPIVLKKPDEKKEDQENEAKTEKPQKISGPASLDLRVAVVTEVRDHPQADKLYILKVDIGSEQRQLCAGLKPFYTKNELLGKHLVVVTNLKPAKLRGELSQGMLLAADSGSVVGVLNAPGSPPGMQVAAEGVSGRGAPQIEIGDVATLRMESKAGKAYVNAKLLLTDVETVQVDKEIEGRIR